MRDTDEAVEVSREWLVEVDSTTSWVAHRVNREVLGADNERRLLAISAEARRLAAARDGGEVERGLRAVADAAERVDMLGYHRTNDPGIIRNRTVARGNLRATLVALHADKEGE